MAYQSTTLTTLLARLATRYDGQPFWTADQARRAINEGLRVWSLITGTWQGANNLTTIPNDPYLVVAGTLTKATRVAVNGQYLYQTSILGLDRSTPNWEGTTTATSGAPSRPTMWAPVGLTEIAIYPADATVLGSPCVVDGVRSTTILVNGGDFLDLGDEEINTLLGYALHVLSFYKGAEALKMTRPLMVAFLQAAIKRNAIFAAGDAYRKIVGKDWTRYIDPMEQGTAPQQDAALAALGGGDAGGGA